MAPRRRVPQGHFEFVCHVVAEPVKVWSALTTPCSTGRYLYGLAARSSWRAGDPIEFDSATGYRLVGRVLHVEEPHRLTYLLQAGDTDPCTYLTWQLRPSPGGCTVELHVDDVDGTDDRHEAENVWLPVLAALQRLVAGLDLAETGTPDTAIGEPA